MKNKKKYLKTLDRKVTQMIHNHSVNLLSNNEEYIKDVVIIASMDRHKKNPVISAMVGDIEQPNEECIEILAEIIRQIYDQIQDQRNSINN